MENIYNLIKIDDESITHKYLQISNSIIKAVEEKRLEQEYPLPSINDMSYELDVSRDTVEKAYRHLKNLGIVGSVPGKGYFIININYNQNIRVFLLFNKLSAHKKLIYDSFAATLGDRAAIDFYIHNNSYQVFKKLISTRKDNYTHFVIIPHFIEDGKDAGEILKTLPADRLVLLDKLVEGLNENVSAVYENFQQDLYCALEQATSRLQKYRKIKMIFPKETYHPEEIIEGFELYCKNYAFEHSIVHKIANETIEEGDVYINLMEDDLVILVEKIMATGLVLGENVGIISYNETALKKIILNGITTISTDFKLMGQKTAEIILNNSTERFAVPFNLTLRNSL